MALKKEYFIKSPRDFVREFTNSDPAPMFRKAFHVKDEFSKATLTVCGLGIGYYWINGKKTSEDLFTSPTGNYEKTLWYQVYDVTELLQAGENIAAAMVGNGFYNEALDTPWQLKTAPWRDSPKFAFNLQITYPDATETVVSDDSWKCFCDGPVKYHQIHTGEHFDARCYDANWNLVDFDDSQWEQAILDKNPPHGEFRECLCEPIRECGYFPAIDLKKTGDNRYLFDIGQNISGYIRLNICQPKGTEIIIHYAEQIEGDELNHNAMEVLYPSSEFETDHFICSGGYDTWSPKFTYHGFRYIELNGVIGNVDLSAITGVFVHQEVEDLTEFFCSDPMLNKLYRLGKLSTLSNLFYIPTDCPTREKLGWTNDMQSSANQMLTNFNLKKFFEKWMRDIYDAMDERGRLPSIIPSAGWGYDDLNGPVADGILFELPYKMFLYTGDDRMLQESIPYFRRYLDFLKSTAHENGLIGFGLSDWAGPFDDPAICPTPTDFIGTIFYIKFLRIAAFAQRRFGNLSEAFAYEQEISKMTALFHEHYLNKDGSCKICEQTAVSMVIYYGLYNDLEPLKRQLKQTVEERNFHHYCGMVGLRRLYYALDICGLSDYAYQVVTAKGFPSYSKWFDEDATTLWETWYPKNSKNHHMYSDVLNWMMVTLGGICPTFSDPGFHTVEIAPAFVNGLNSCKASCKTVSGTIKTEWNREEDTVVFCLEVPVTVKVKFGFPNASILQTVVENTHDNVRYRLKLNVINEKN